MSEFVITQAELRAISELEREIPRMKRELDERRGAVDLMLREGIKLEEGRFEAELVTCISRPVPWKVICLEQLGQAAFDAIKKRFKASIYKKLVVREHAILPLWRQNEKRSDEMPN